jgi:chlorobactene glucosyltransferase
MPPLLTAISAGARAVSPLTVYQIGATLLSVFSLVNAARNGFDFQRPQPSETPDAAQPSLSVLIPARNEAGIIGECVRSLLAQGYSGPYEIIILDDGSTDGTADAALAAAAGDGRVRIATGGPLLPGWKGKPNALRQLAALATGELLLLTDADCVFYPGALSAAVRHRERCGVDCLSLIPHLVCASFWEHIIVPLQYDVVFLTLPIRKVTGSRTAAFAAANGAFLLLPAATYAALGGHESVRGEMAEDIKFAQHVKRAGFKLAYGDGSRTYRVRMYGSLREIWEGFSKNLYPAMGRSLPVLIAWSVFHLTTQVLPFAFVLAALLNGDRSRTGFALPFLGATIAVGIRAALTVRFRQAAWAIPTHPIGWLITVAIGANSAYQSLSGRGHSWKGRVYTS